MSYKNYITTSYSKKIHSLTKQYQQGYTEILSSKITNFIQERKNVTRRIPNEAIKTGAK